MPKSIGLEMKLRRVRNAVRSWGSRHITFRKRGQRKRGEEKKTFSMKQKGKEIAVGVRKGIRVLH